MKTLKDFCLNINDGEHSSVTNDESGKYFLLSNKNLDSNKIKITEDDRKINKSTYDSLYAKQNLERGDVLISTVGTIGKALVLNENKPDFVFQRSVGIIKVDKTELLPHYLKYLLETSWYQKALRNLAHGGVQMGIYISDLEKLSINPPSIDEQEKIVKNLIDIDSKIDINKRINDNLSYSNLTV